MQACRDGGAAIEQALRALDRAFYAILYRDGVRAVRDADLARDLVQETFIKVWQRCATFRGDSELLPWIRSILRHTILDRLRVPDRDVALEQDGAVIGEVERHLAAGSARSGDDPARRRELGACFARCWERFERAAPAHAAVLAWIAEDGLTHDEIGQLLGRTPGATREFVSQCRKKARVHLAEWYELAFGKERP